MTEFFDFLNHLAGSIGYIKPIPTIISHSPADMTLSVDGSIDCGTYLGGDIDIGHEAEIKRGTRLLGKITIERNAKVGRDSELLGDVTVGRYTQLNGSNYTKGEVSIGQFCAIAERTGFYAENHDMDSWAMQHKFQTDHGINFEKKQKPVDIGSDVWCGMDAIVLPGVTVNHGACVGAHSVVTRDVAPYEIVAGNPAEHIGWRFSEKTRQAFLELEWWNWPIDEIVKRVDELYNLAVYQPDSL